MVKKQYLKSRNIVKLTFEIPAYQLPKSIEVQKVHLVGEFNEWSEQANLMKRQKNGMYKISIEVPPNTEYQYRYLANDRVWFNDWDADRYIQGNWGADNCVVIATR